MANHKPGVEVLWTFGGVDCNVRRRWPVYVMRNKLEAVLLNPNLTDEETSVIKETIEFLDRRCS